MRRFILTGIFALGLCAGSFSLASADELPAAVQPVTAAITAPQPEAAVPQPAPAAQAATADAAPPTAGADLSMWNATATSPQVEAVPDTVKHVSRLRRFASGIINRSSAIASSLTRSAMRFLGTPYVFGGSKPGGFDCSGYVQHVFAMIGMHLPRTADAQYDAGRRIVAAMAPGDLVFFHTYAPGVSHVGIYLGNNKFIHSSSSHGVSIASLHDSYWAPRYLGAKRVVGR